MGDIETDIPEKRQENNMLIMPLVIQNIENDDDRNYMERLYREYVSRMYSIARKYGATHNNEDDIVSECVKSLIEKIHELSEKDNRQLSAYIFTVVRNKTFDFNRKAHREQHLVRIDHVDDHDKFEGPDTVEGQILQREKIDMIRNITFRLPPLVREVLRMKCQEHLSVLEITAQTGLPENEIWNCLRRARYFIRKKADEEDCHD